MKLLRCLPLVLIVSFSISITCPAAVRVEQLINDLAADSFSAREEATRLFLEQDPRVIPLVRNLLQTTDDAEVKQRARRILMVLEERDLDARLQAFLRDSDEKQGVSLPGWKQFRQVARAIMDSRVMQSAVLSGDFYATTRSKTMARCRARPPIFLKHEIDKYIPICGKNLRIDCAFILKC